jgi:hypothetical protein
MLTLTCETERNAHVSYSNGALWWAHKFETGVRAHSALRNRTKRTRQLHQRGNGLLRNGRGSKLGVTHFIGRVAENLAGFDSYSSA